MNAKSPQLPLTTEQAKRLGVEFALEPLEEFTPVRGNALASGDDDEDRAAEDSIIADLESGNEWAWCTAHVTASFGGFIGHAYLGCCSYRNGKEFREGGYLDDMEGEALASLIAELESAQQTLATLGASNV